MALIGDTPDWHVVGCKCPPRSLFDLSGRVALVSGAASGLGRAIALGLDAFGARVILADRDAAGAAAVAAVLDQTPVDAFPGSDTHSATFVSQMNVTTSLVHNFKPTSGIFSATTSVGVSRES